MISALVVLCLSAGGNSNQFAEAKAVVAELARPGADAAALSKKLRPTPADYAAVFEGDLAKLAQVSYGKFWDSGQVVIEGKPGQTETIVFSATVEELRAGTGNAKEFPGGYSKIAPMMKAGLRVYAFKFLEPGKTLGMAYDGLIFVNGHWVIFPKPWKFARAA